MEKNNSKILSWDLNTKVYINELQNLYVELNALKKSEIAINFAKEIYKI